MANQHGSYSNDENNDILNQSYEDIYSIDENAKAITGLSDYSKYQSCGKQSLIFDALDKNNSIVGIARYSRDDSTTRNCLNYAFLASCGERAPHILTTRSNGNKNQFEVQRFFLHDGRNNYFSPNENDSLIYFTLDMHKKIDINADNCTTYRSYLRMYHILTKRDDASSEKFIDHYATLFADELCFNIYDRNCGNMIIVQSKDKNKKDIVNLDVDFCFSDDDDDEDLPVSLYGKLYLIAKIGTFTINESNFDQINSELNDFYKNEKLGYQLDFKFQNGQKLQVDSEIINKIDKKIIEKIEQRLNFRKDKFVQYYIDNCIRRGDIDLNTAFSDYQSFMQSLYKHLEKCTNLLCHDKNFGHFSEPFNDFMKKNKDYQIFNNLSEEDFCQKWTERKKVLTNPTKIDLIDDKIKKNKNNDKTEQKDANKIQSLSTIEILKSNKGKNIYELKQNEAMFFPSVEKALNQVRSIDKIMIQGIKKEYHVIRDVNLSYDGVKKTENEIETNCQINILGLNKKNRIYNIQHIEESVMPKQTELTIESSSIILDNSRTKELSSKSSVQNNNGENKYIFYTLAFIITVASIVGGFCITPYIFLGLASLNLLFIPRLSKSKSQKEQNLKFVSDIQNSENKSVKVKPPNMDSDKIIKTENIDNSIQNDKFNNI